VLYQRHVVKTQYVSYFSLLHIPPVDSVEMVSDVMAKNESKAHLFAILNVI